MLQAYTDLSMDVGCRYVSTGQIHRILISKIWEHDKTFIFVSIILSVSRLNLNYNIYLLGVCPTQHLKRISRKCQSV